MKQIHVVPWPTQPYVFLRSRTGEVYTYESYAHFLYYVPSKILTDLDKDFRPKRQYYTTWAGGRFYTNAVPEYVAESLGKSLDPQKVIADWHALWDSARVVNKNSYFYLINHRVYKFRDGPVPHIHHRRWHRGCGCSRMRVTQEKKWSYAEKDDGVKWRAKRNHRHLPDPWNEYPRSRRGDNWKHYRKTQWK